MKQPPDLALISEQGGFFSRAVSRQEPQPWLLRDCSVTLLPLLCKPGAKAVHKGLGAAYGAGCRVAAIAPEKRAAVSVAPLQLADGRLLALSSIKHRLDIDCPGWNKDTLCLSADDNFSCLAARWLAPYCGRLHICGTNAAKRQALVRLLYAESGLIASQSLLARADTLFIQPPGQPSGQSAEAGGAFIWQGWPLAATNGHGEIFPGHLAEGLLLAAGSLPPGIKPLRLLRLLKHRGRYFEIFPI